MAGTRIAHAQYRILVTGSRGKSSVVRLLHAALLACGLDARSRITGVCPRELSRSGERTIIRNSPAHVREMRWWLRQMPAGTAAVVAENSAVNPDLQHLAAVWLAPTLIVLTNVRDDHQEAWGRDGEAAARALSRGLPAGVPLIIGAEAASSAYLRTFLASRSAPVLTSGAIGRDYREANLSIARAALGYLSLMAPACEAAMRALSPDIGDFRVFMPGGGAMLAAAFAANDLASTEHLFSLLGWREEETCLYFSDRADRPGRRASFQPFLRLPWREALIADVLTPAELCEWMRGKRVFGCGNIAGTPLELLKRLIGEGCPWTIPDA